VIVSGSGAVDLQRAVFRSGAVKTLIVTSHEGAELLAQNSVAAFTSSEVRAIEGLGGKIAPAAILRLLRDEFGVKILLHEGGPALFGDFVAHGCVDELFLTVAPQFAGRDLGHILIALVCYARRMADCPLLSLYPEWSSCSASLAIATIRPVILASPAGLSETASQSHCKGIVVKMASIS
jgi:riboflavin biosynthesis pyrimidine reductase